MFRKGLGCLVLFLSFGLIVFSSCATTYIYGESYSEKNNKLEGFRQTYLQALDLYNSDDLKECTRVLFDGNLMLGYDGSNRLSNFDKFWKLLNRYLESSEVFCAYRGNDFHCETSRGFGLFNNLYGITQKGEDKLKQDQSALLGDVGNLIRELSAKIKNQYLTKQKESLVNGEYFKEFEKKLPRLYSYLKSKDYLKYASGDMKYDLKNLRTTLLKDCDDFEAYDLVEIIKKDILHLFENTDFIGIVDSGDDKIEVSSITPDFNTKTYNYKMDNWRLSYDYEFLYSLEDGLHLLGVKSLDSEIFAKYNYKVKAILNLITNNEEIYKSEPCYIRLRMESESKYDSADRLYYLYCPELDWGEWDKLIFKNIPYKSYKSFSIDSTTEVELRKDETKSGSNQVSNGNNSTSSTSLKDLFGTIICEECGKHLALYDCFDPVKNVRVSLCRPCLQKKQQEYNAKYQKAIKDIKNL